ncbi:MAG: serine hydrolase [Bacteroidetes bacterium]|nr:serine hydrolase [Bacteroidota bacterium]
MRKKILLSGWFVLAFFFHSHAQTMYFPPLSGNSWSTLSPQSLGWCQNRIDSLYNYLEDNNTKAFILLKDGKIVFEKYFGTHTATTPWQWASAGKTVTAFMLGIAQQEKRLSLSDPTSKYLGKGWTRCTPQQEDKITIWHQLTMTSGLDDKVPDHFCTLDTCLIYKADTGTRWAYHNGPYTLLDSVMEVATGTKLNSYTTQKLKSLTGMTGQFFKVGYNNVYFSTARSMARFGLLMLNKGNWNGTPIMTDTNYFNQMINTSQSINLSYGYLWWLNGKASHMLPGSQVVFDGFMNPNAPADMYSAMGKDGQFINVVPSQNLVWIRMGEAPDKLPVPYLLNNAIWSYINQLSCTVTGVEETNRSKIKYQIFPNPSTGQLYFNADKKVVKIAVFNMQGQLLKSANFIRNSGSLSTNDLSAGQYLLKADFLGGGSITEKFYKQ